ncbi:MAG: cysteine--tRNA ligase [Syntrophomonadaceae bacterium]|jgi:cysteinyl-tRNA synthetase
MRIYNTSSRKKEEFKPLNPPAVTMYVCGPTTYNYIHMGNARPMVVFDMVRRYLEYKGYQVTYVQNFTDVDDKIINRANACGEEPLHLAQRYINEFYSDADALGIKRADINPRASQHINDMIEVISGLIDQGFAYELEGDVYFRVRNFTGYGKLSGRSLDDMLSGARVDVNERKEDPVDFALWKKAKAGEPFWESPWGKGRPGWHIECSVMSTKYLGDTIDIHGGGSDLIFPHHENEIAQAEASTGKPFVRYWMHNGFITVNNEKMSKSLGNFFILRDILNKYPSDVVRFYLIATHYRSPLDFDDSKLEEAHKALGRLKTTLILADEFLDMDIAAEDKLTGAAADLVKSVEGLKSNFTDAMDDDFNTAKAMGFLFEISRAINSFISGAQKNNAVHQAAVKKAVATFRSLGDILGIFMDQEQDQPQGLDQVIEILAELRQIARRDKDFALADRIRDFLKDLDIAVEDTPDGSRIRYEKSPDMDHLIKFVAAIRGEFKQKKQYDKADFIRDRLKDNNIVLEDTREGVRWKVC